MQALKKNKNSNQFDVNIESIRENKKKIQLNIKRCWNILRDNSPMSAANSKHSDFILRAHTMWLGSA